MSDDEKQNLDWISGHIFSNYFWDEGIRPNNIDNYSNDELWNILKNYKKSRYFTKSGWRIGYAEEYLKLANAIKLPAKDHLGNKIVRWNASIVLAFVALEEIVNMYIQISNVGIKEANEYQYRGVDLREILSKDIMWKLDTYVYELSHHSLKEDKPEWWDILRDAKAVRNDVVHNHADVDKFIKRDSDRLAKIDREVISKRFIEIVPEIQKWLLNNYPTEVDEVDNQFKELWEILKKRLNYDLWIENPLNQRENKSSN